LSILVENTTVHC